MPLADQGSSFTIKCTVLPTKSSLRSPKYQLHLHKADSANTRRETETAVAFCRSMDVVLLPSKELLRKIWLVFQHLGSISPYRVPVLLFQPRRPTSSPAVSTDTLYLMLRLQIPRTTIDRGW